jgi:transcription antitermination factor NusG
VPAQNHVTESGEAIFFKVKLMLMKDGKQWHLVFSKLKCEKKVKDTLSKYGIENYRPLTAITRQVNRQNKTLYKPLFDRYIFVLITNAQKQLVQQIDGVQNFVFWLGKPVTITIEEITMIKNFTSTYEEVHIERIEIVADEINSPAVEQMYQGVEDSASDTNGFVKVMLPALGYAMVAAAKKSNVEVININRSRSHESGVFKSSFR